MELPEDLPLSSFPKREDPRDALILKKDIDEVPFRRSNRNLQQTKNDSIETLYPECKFHGIRGNVQTRMGENWKRKVLMPLYSAAPGLRQLVWELL